MFKIFKKIEERFKKIEEELYGHDPNSYSLFFPFKNGLINDHKWIVNKYNNLLSRIIALEKELNLVYKKQETRKHFYIKKEDKK